MAGNAETPFPCGIQKPTESDGATGPRGHLELEVLSFIFFRPICIDDPCLRREVIFRNARLFARKITFSWRTEEAQVLSTHERRLVPDNENTFDLRYSGSAREFHSTYLATRISVSGQSDFHYFLGNITTFYTAELLGSSTKFLLALSKMVDDSESSQRGTNEIFKILFETFTI